MSPSPSASPPLSTTATTPSPLRAVLPGPQNVVQLSVHLATLLLEETVGFLRRALEAELPPMALEQLGDSFLLSTLLPTTLAQLGPIACQQPKVGERETGLWRGSGGVLFVL